MKRALWLGLLAIITILAVIAALGLPLGPIQIIVGLLFALIVPGNALTLAVFPGNQQLNWQRRLPLSIAFSVALAVPLGLILSETPWGLHGAPFVGILALISLVILAIGWWRYDPLADVAAANTQPLALYFSNRRDQVLAGIVALLIVGTAIWAGVGISRASAGPAQTFTAFFLTNARQPIATSAGSKVDTIGVGVTNHEGRLMEYRLVTTVNGTPSGSSMTITLANGATWRGVLTFPAPAAGEVQCLLFRSGDQMPYRTLHIWLAGQ
jgi:uncharacterized membrane protein